MDFARVWKPSVLLRGCLFMSFTTANLSPKDYARTMKARGWVTFENVLSPDVVVSLGAALVRAQDRCAEYQMRNKVEANTDGTSHHILLHEKVFFDLLESSPLHEYLTEHFEGHFFLHSFGGVINVKNKRPYVCNVHRDVKFHTQGFTVLLNMLIMLDDFTLENGATHLLTGGHSRPDKPSDEQFFSEADRALGKKVRLFCSTPICGTARALTIRTTSEKRSLSYSPDRVSNRCSISHAPLAMILDQHSPRTCVKCWGTMRAFRATWTSGTSHAKSASTTQVSKKRHVPSQKQSASPPS